MTDVFSKKQRSEIMKKITPRNSIPEKIVKNILKSCRYNFLSHSCNLPGTPDFVFRSKKKVIFINGCFWHGHKNCKRSRLPATNRVFWNEKIKRNILNDRKVRSKIRILGWKYLTIWQCEIKNKTQEMLKIKINTFLKTK